MLKPYKKNLYIKADIDSEQQTTTGIVLSNNTDTLKPLWGEIKALGQDSEFRLGQRVLFSRYGATDVSNLSDPGYYIVHEEHILAIENE